MPTTYHIPLKSLQPVHMKIIDLYLKCWKKKELSKLWIVLQAGEQVKMAFYKAGG